MHLALIRSASLLMCGCITLSQAACTYYCNIGDTLSGATCVSTYAAACPSGYSWSGGQCVGSPCSSGGTFCSSASGASNPNTCASGSFASATSSTCGPGTTCIPGCGGPGGYYCNVITGTSRCYSSPIPATYPCSSGGTLESDTKCTIAFPCSSGYNPFPTTGTPTACRRTYTAATITNLATCTGYSPSTDECQWCSAIKVCVATITAPTCPATCPDATQSVCIITTSTCKWCDLSTGSIGVCQLFTGTCYPTCLAATNEPTVCALSASCKYCQSPTSIGVCQPAVGVCYATCRAATVEAPVCSTSTACQWCPSDTSIGVCQPNAGTCWSNCTSASDDLLGSDVCTTSADCKWCATLGYCTERPRTCHEVCTTVAPDEPGICQVQSIQPQCQWCGTPGSVEYCVARGDEARLRCAASCSGLIWRRDVCDGALECHWCGVHSAAQGGRCKPLPGKSRGYVAWRREVDCDTGSESQSFSSPMSFTTSASESVTQTSTLSASWTASASESPSKTDSFTPSSTFSVTETVSKTITRSATVTLTSASLSVSFRLPPCNATHLETLAYVWPRLFNFTTSYSAVQQVGFPSVLVAGDVRDPALIYRVPLLLRREVLYHARPVYVVPVPYETPNVDGFVGRADSAPIELSWVSRTTLNVTMAAIPDYWLDTADRITIDVPFEEIELCNRTDPVSLYVAPTLQLVGVDIVGPRVDTAGSVSVEVVAGIAGIVALVTGDPSSGTSIQTLAVIGMSPCSHPTSKQTLASLRALGPLPVGIDGYAGVVVGNIVITAAVGMMQFCVVRGFVDLKRGSVLEGCEVVRAPSMTIASFFSFYQGTFYASSQLLARPGMDDGERGGGAVAFTFAFAVPLLIVWLCRTHLPRMCIAYDYRRSRKYEELYTGPVAFVMLPHSRIEPAHLRRRYSTLVASYKSPHDVLPVLPIVIPFLLTLLSLWSPTSANECTAYFSLALSIHVVVVAAMLFARPFRLKYDLPLTVLGIAVNSLLLLLSVVSISNPRFVVSSMTFALLVAQLAIQVVKMLLRFWSARLEDLLEGVPTRQLWAIGCATGSVGDLAVSMCDDLTVDVELLTVGLLEGVGLPDGAYLKEAEEVELHQLLDDTLLMDVAQEVHQDLELMPVAGGCDVADAPVGGDQVDLSDLTQALETLERFDEEIRLRDELRLSVGEPLVIRSKVANGGDKVPDGAIDPHEIRN